MNISPIIINYRLQSFNYGLEHQRFVHNEARDGYRTRERGSTRAQGMPREEALYTRLNS